MTPFQQTHCAFAGILNLVAFGFASEAMQKDVASGFRRRLQKSNTPDLRGGAESLAFVTCGKSLWENWLNSDA